MDILKLNKYEERSYRETPNQSGFVNYGDDNLFPQYLVDLFHSSATHNALSTTIAMMIFGDGFDASSLEGHLAFDKWSLNDELRKVAVDALDAHNAPASAFACSKVARQQVLQRSRGSTAAALARPP